MFFFIVKKERILPAKTISTMLFYFTCLNLFLFLFCCFFLSDLKVLTMESILFKKNTVSIYPTNWTECPSHSVIFSIILHFTVIQIDFVARELQFFAGPVPKNSFFFLSSTQVGWWFTLDSNCCVVSGQYGATSISCHVNNRGSLCESSAQPDKTG